MDKSELLAFVIGALSQDVSKQKIVDASPKYANITIEQYEFITKNYAALTGETK